MTILILIVVSLCPTNLPYVSVSSMQDQSDNYDVSGLRTMFLRGNALQRNRAKKRLLATANKSAARRGIVIQLLIEIADSVDEEHPTVRFAVWRDAVDLLGRLRAYEAIDVLIRHLDHNDGTIGLSASHTPTARALVRIGEPAVPKLTEALLESSTIVRASAAQALGDIGGDQATEALERALKTETDDGVRRWLEIALSCAQRRSR